MSENNLDFLQPHHAGIVGLALHILHQLQSFQVAQACCQFRLLSECTHTSRRSELFADCAAQESFETFSEKVVMHAGSGSPNKFNTSDSLHELWR